MVSGSSPSRISHLCSIGIKLVDSRFRGNDGSQTGRHNSPFPRSSSPRKPERECTGWRQFSEHCRNTDGRGHPLCSGLRSKRERSKKNSTTDDSFSRQWSLPLSDRQPWSCTQQQPFAATQGAAEEASSGDPVPTPGGIDGKREQRVRSRSCHEQRRISDE